MAPFRMLCGAAVSVAILAMASAAVISAASQVQAQAQQQYPNKPVTIISDSAAGSTPDAVLRVIADRLSQMWGATSPCSESSRRHGQHRFANCSRLSA